MADWDIEQGQMAEWLPDDGPKPTDPPDHCPECGAYVSVRYWPPRRCAKCKGKKRRLLEVSDGE